MHHNIDPDADPVDMHVGQRIRTRRRAVGMSQDALGSRCNITLQQIQKYERAANRVSCSMLARVARALDVPIAWFFEGIDQSGAPVGDPLLNAWTQSSYGQRWIAAGYALGQTSGFEAMTHVVETFNGAAQRRAA